jgi:hypothetical protein
VENAEADMRAVAAFLGAGIDEQRFREELLGDDWEQHQAGFSGRLLDEHPPALSALRRLLARLKR